MPRCRGAAAPRLGTGPVNSSRQQGLVIPLFHRFEVQGAARAPLAGLHALPMNKPVVIGNSTGGLQALKAVLTVLPADAPGIAIGQHMPDELAAMHAQRLDASCAMNVRDQRSRLTCAMSVRKARDGHRPERGVVLIAPRRTPHAAEQRRLPVLRRGGGRPARQPPRAQRRCVVF